MNQIAKLTPREVEIAEFLAWGSPKKIIASILHISVRTVENTARNIFVKAGVNSATELSAWWFCTRYNISFDISPLKRKVITAVLLCLVLPRELFSGQDTHRIFRTRTTANRALRCARTRRSREENAAYFEDYITYDA